MSSGGSEGNLVSDKNGEAGSPAEETVADAINSSQTTAATLTSTTPSAMMSSGGSEGDLGSDKNGDPVSAAEETVADAVSSSQTTAATPTSSTTLEMSSLGGSEGDQVNDKNGVAGSPMEETVLVVAPGSESTTVLSPASGTLTMGPTSTGKGRGGPVNRRKRTPKKAVVAQEDVAGSNMDFPLNIIVKEEILIDDDQFGSAMNTEMDCPTGVDMVGPPDGIWIAQNGTSTSPKGGRGRKKKCPAFFQKPTLIKSSPDTATLVFVVPNEEMESVVIAKKKRKERKEEEYEELHWCDICDDCFKDEGELDAHMETHLGEPEEDHDCEDCGKVFGSAPELERHKSKKHGKMRYCCDTCGIQYNFKSQFVIHMRAHSGEKPFTCDQCGQEFGHKCSLVIHQRKHTGSTPHECRNCWKMFDTRAALLRHEKMRYCPDCKKCYTSRGFPKHLAKNCAKP